VAAVGVRWLGFELFSAKKPIRWEAVGCCCGGWEEGAPLPYESRRWDIPSAATVGKSGFYGWKIQFPQLENPVASGRKIGTFGRENRNAGANSLMAGGRD